MLDVLPIAQHVWSGSGWKEMGVGLGPDGRLAFEVLPGASPQPGAMPGTAPGDIRETRDCGSVVEGLRRLATGGPVAALFIDYGYAGPALGDTLQAVRGQRYEHALTSPGEADLTAHVDFSAFATEAQAVGLACQGPVTQAEFLGQLGMVERASRLMAANPAKAAAIEAGIARLMAPGGMGGQFKVLGVRSPGLAGLPGLPSVDNAPTPHKRVPAGQQPAHPRRRDMPKPITADCLADIGAIDHGFFTREGGVSEGIYGSLNCGVGSKDERARVLENRCAGGGATWALAATGC